MRRRTTAFLSIVPVVAAGAVARTAPAASAATGPGLSVDLLAPTTPISRDIYGMNFADEALAAELKLPVRRWGGNATTRYNYMFDTTNRGSDWYFENVPGTGHPAQLPLGSQTDVFVEQDRRTATSSILTVPLIGWVPRGRDSTCGFSIAKYGPQRASDTQWRPDCGNGVRPDGTPVTGNDPHDTSVEAGGAYVTRWLRHLTGRYGTAANGGVKYYSLDNEPDLWHSTHRDVHPAGASYDEIRDSTYEIGAAVKAGDPGAKTLGPVGWGWNSLFMSGLDQETCGRLGGSCWSNPPDRAAHGGTAFGEWYLAQMRAYEEQHGRRILDYYDNHWYPQGTGVAFGNGTDPATNALRLRSTRNLWDPTYVDESWINDETRLIPRMKEMVATNYPGTKTAVTEYNWGALDHINGALAQADVLGIFGREGLDLATLWAPPAANQPGAFAYRMFLNFNGQGGAFGDTSVKATSSDQDKLSVYAARGGNRPLTMVVVNKTGEELTSSIGVRGGSPGAVSAEAWHYGAADTGRIVRGANFPIAVAPVCVGCTPYYSVMGRFPPNSITTVVVGRSVTPVPPTAPGTPVASEVTTTGFTATWAPAADDVGVARYEGILTDGVNDTYVDAGTRTSHTFRGLDPGRTYTLRMRAIDTEGQLGPYSPAAEITLPRDPGDTIAPTVPGVPRATSWTPTTLTLSWAPSTDNVGVTGYEVSLHAGKEHVRTVEVTGTTHTFTGLSTAWPYHFYVRARDAAGNWSQGAAGGPVRLDDDGDVGPTTPGKPTISQVGSSGFTVNWAASTDDNGVARYEVWDESGDTFVKLGETTAPATTLAVTGRPPATTFSVVVRAVDTVGQFSGFSPPTAVTTLPTSSACAVSYRVVSQWQGGFQGEVTVRNGGTTPFTGWAVTWTYPAGQRITQLWNGAWTPGTEPVVTVRNLNWNGTVPAGQSRTFGFTGTFQGTNPAPLPTCSPTQ